MALGLREHYSERCRALVTELEASSSTIGAEASLDIGAAALWMRACVCHQASTRNSHVLQPPHPTNACHGSAACRDQLASTCRQADLVVQITAVRQAGEDDVAIIQSGRFTVDMKLVSRVSRDVVGHRASDGSICTMFGDYQLTLV